MLIFYYEIQHCQKCNKSRVLYVFGGRILINVFEIFGFVSASSLNTPPGTKIKLSGIVEVRNGFLLLDDSNTAVLGGEVEHLIEKWELQRVR